jgi:hypothetical protein
MTKALLLLPGLARFCKDFDTQLEALTNADIDWNICLWDHGHAQDTRISPGLTVVNEQSIRALVEPKLPENHRIVHLEVLDRGLAPSPPRDYTPFYANPPALWAQFHLLKYCAQRVDFNDYDLVIRSRCDIGVDRELDLASIHTQLLSSKPGTIVMPTNERRGPNDLCDQFAIGLPHDMQTYCRVIDHIDHAYTGGCPFNPEYLVGHILSAQGLTWPQWGFNIGLRAQGHHVPGHFHPEFGRWLSHNNNKSTRSLESKR